MKHIKHWLISIIALLCSITANAHDLVKDGIYYKILSNEKDNYMVEVTYRGRNAEDYSNEYSGIVMIPSTITNNGMTYRVVSIGHSAFKDCSNLSFINFPDGITSIGDYAFYGCNGLTYLTIPEGVLSIGELTFDGCSKLFSVSFPESLKNIGDLAFRDCSSLYTIEIPNGVTYIGKHAFYGSAWYNTKPYGIIYAGKNLYCYKGTIPENTSIEVNKGTVSICPYAFANCTGLTSITIPESIKSIGENAFSGTTWYENQPDGIVYLSQILYAYKGTMPENTSIDIKNGTISIPNNFFNNCENLIAITIPDGVMSIGDNAFRNCRNLSTVSIGNSVEHIGHYAFNNCSSLATLTMGKNVKTIGNNVFEYCSNLKTVTIPNSVTNIGESVFSHCLNLTSISFGSSLIGISNNAFKECYKLNSVVFNSDLSYIGDYAFYSCESLNEIVIPNSVTEIGERAFTGCDNLSSVFFGNSLTYIGKYAFSYCGKLSSIEIHEQINRIDHNAFENCSGLKTVIFRKKSAFVIESMAFNKCTNLSHVYYKATSVGIDFLGVGAFTTPITRNATLHVPKSRLEWFQKADVWKTFGSIVPLPVLTYIVDSIEYQKDDMIDGELIIPVKEPYKTGYSFSGWSELPDTMPNHDITTYGTFTINKYLVTYKIGEEIVASDSIEYGATVLPPEAPGKEGYTFIGWNDVPETMPARDIVIHGFYEETAVKLGDVNADGVINVSDVSAIVGMLIKFDAPPYEKAADVNSDGIINVSDVSAIVGMLLSDNQSNKLDAPAAPAAMTTYNEVASSVFIEPFQINPGEEKEILVNLNTPDLGVISFQFDLVLPEGVKVVYEEDGDDKYYIVERGSRLPRSYNIEGNMVGDNTFRVVGYSSKNDKVKNTTGDIVKILVRAADAMADGIYDLKFAQTTLTNPDSQSVYPEDTTCAVSVGNATGVNGVNAASERQTIYDLSGRPTDAKKRGVYIINGKKVMVK